MTLIATLLDAENLALKKYSFARDIDTLGVDGLPVGSNLPRFSKRKAVAGRPVWTDTGIDVGTATSNFILAAGMAHDGETPIVITLDGASQIYRFWTGETLTQSASVTFAQWATLLSAPANHTYVVAHFRVHHGLIIAALERKISNVVDGVTLAVSQDLGVTWAYVPVQGVTPSATVSAGDVPRAPLTGELPLANVIARWSISVFPVKGIRDIREMRFTWCDYQSKAANPGGYQIGAFVASRTSDTGNWTIRNNRLIGEVEIAGQSGFHGHATSADDAGMVVVCGDVGYRNRFDRYVFDWATYETATITTQTEWYGESDFTDTFRASVPQPTSACPWGDGGSVWSSDGDDALVTYIGGTKQATDKAVVGAADRRSVRRLNGYPSTSPSTDTNTNQLPLHLRCVSAKDQTVWAGGSRFAPSLSLDGQHMARMMDVDTSQVITDGKNLYRLDVANLLKSPIPAFKHVTPLKASPGQANFVDNTWVQHAAPGGTNTVVQVYYDGRTWRYSSDDAALVPQPKELPQCYGPFYEITCTATSINAGQHRIGGEGNTFDTGVQSNFLAFIQPLGNESATMEFQPYYLNPGVQISTGGITYWEVSPNDGWSECPLMWNRAALSTSRAVVQWTARNSSKQVKARFLIGLQLNAVNIESPYPIRPRTTTAPPDEIVQVPLAVTGTPWTVGCMIHLPQETPMYGVQRKFFTLFADANNYIEVTEESTTTQIKLVKNGTTTDNVTISTDDLPGLHRGDHVYILFSNNGTAITVHLATPAGSHSLTLSDTLGATPVRIHNGNVDQSSICTLDFVAAGTWDTAFDEAAKDAEFRDLTIVDGAPAVSPESSVVNPEYRSRSWPLGYLPSRLRRRFDRVW